MDFLRPALILACGIQAALAQQDINWLLQYDGKSLPGPEWSVQGKPNAKLEDGALRITTAETENGSYRATWTPVPDAEIIVEATVKQLTLPPPPGEKRRSEPSWFIRRDGAPVSLRVSDGRDREGLVLFPGLAMTCTDRFIKMDTTDGFHTYRLVIRGQDMSVWVDGQQRVQGQGAFAWPADGTEAYLEFGSTSKKSAGDALWQSVKLGIRKPTTTAPELPLKITVSESWPIPRTDEVVERCPYLYDMGNGLLLLCVAQGPDKLYGNYALHRSTDAGKTWTPIEGLDKVNITPLPMLRLPDGRIFGASRWTWLQEKGDLRGKTFLLDPEARTFTMTESRLELPAELIPVNTASDVVIFERHIFQEADGGIVAAVWSRRMYWSDAEKRNITERRTHLLRTTDLGQTWRHLSTVGPGGEPAIVKLSTTDMMAVIRGEDSTQMTQVYSRDSGRTWEPFTKLEEGRVAPDLVMMSHGVLACSYGRPASCIMFSLDQGKTWTNHQVISDRVFFNYAGIREISPGRLLYVHDAPKMNAVYIDVERRK